MTQQDINQQELDNPENWSGKVLPGLYFSKRDTRVIVPKGLPSLGWTVNLAHPAGAWTFIGCLLAPALILAGMLITQG